VVVTTGLNCQRRLSTQATVITALVTTQPVSNKQNYKQNLISSNGGIFQQQIKFSPVISFAKLCLGLTYDLVKIELRETKDV